MLDEEIKERLDSIICRSKVEGVDYGFYIDCYLIGIESFYTPDLILIPELV